MGRIKDLINSFLKPSESEKTFDELAVADGVKPEELKELKAKMNGVKWTGYSEETETEVKTRQTKVPKIPLTRHEKTNPQKQRNDGFER